MPGSDEGINHHNFFFFLKKNTHNFDYLKYLMSIINYTKTKVMLDALLAGQY